MESDSSTVPILFMLFNRPAETKKVFEAIRVVRPKLLFIAADGPRPDRPEDVEKCKLARDVIQGINWKCDVQTLFRDRNLGCKVAVSGAIDWFFSHVEEGIILEDDCVPSQSFFRFCKELLGHYRTDERIMQICGSNLQFGRMRGNGSYYFSKYNHVWGWATWRRAWKFYDVDMQSFVLFEQQNCIASIFDEPKTREYWMEIFGRMHRREIDTWDYQWLYAIWSNNGLCVLPNQNLVTNIGFNAEATHTKYPLALGANQPSSELTDIVHPSFVLPDRNADLYTSRSHYRKRNTMRDRIWNAFKKILRLVK